VDTGEVDAELEVDGRKLPLGGGCPESRGPMNNPKETSAYGFTVE
jgi:hypothetical protein